MLKSIIFFILSMFLSISSYAKTNEVDKNYVVIHGSKFILELYDAQDNLITTYPIGLGKNGLGKTKDGDCKTPVGEYRILWKASRFWQTEGGLPIVDNFTHSGKNNTYQYGPNEDPHGALWRDAYGGKDAVCMCLDYPNHSDIEKGYTGYGIAIHASLLGGIGELASRGCIRMFPEDARELYNQLYIGSYVFIELD